MNPLSSQKYELKISGVPATQLLQDTAIKLFAYCKQNQWSGFDPFDGLNSRLFSAIPFFQNRMAKLLFTQVMKRMPVDLRPLLLVPKSENPKGLAVFCTALFILSDVGLINDDEQILHLLGRLRELRSPNTRYFCWGYNFDWQSRKFFLPKYAPNIICTTFVGNALLDAFKKFEMRDYLDMAISAGNFILDGLNITRDKDEICFSYTPYDQGQVHNANLLGAAFLSRLYSLTQDKKFLNPALSATRYSIRRQNTDGSWAYGEDKTQEWVDNFHTGYNLGALRAIGSYLDTKEFESNIDLGFDFYRNHFFMDNGTPKYFYNSLYPIDVHSVAQSIVTLSEFSDRDEDNLKLANTVFEWAMRNIWDNRGYFYYQVTPYYKNKISYMRWSQSWMLYAIAMLLMHNYRRERIVQKVLADQRMLAAPIQ
jgi:hypothetical protein